MLSKRSYLLVAIVLLVLPILMTGYKYYFNQISLKDIIPREVYEVTLELDIADLPAQSYVKTYLPQSDHRQEITNHSWSGDSLCMDEIIDDSGVIAHWEIIGHSDVLYSYSYDVEGKDVHYQIPENSPFELHLDRTLQPYLSSEPFIQSSHKQIDSLARKLKRNSVLETLRANFEYVNTIKNSYTRVLTDAVRALQLNRASCNGKSRLFTALCRAQGLPARVVGGTILENTQKRTSHLWSEVYYGGNWIPFDVLNGHFAFLPAHYLELYTGDKFLFSHNSNLDFDYQFIINKKYQTLDDTQAKGPQLWPLLSELHISLNLLRTLLLLPLAALLIAIFRNVVGIKTFGILLPALIGLALINVDMKTGLLAFAIVIVLVTLLHIILDKWSLLHVPKVAIILTCVIISLIALGSLGSKIGWKMGEMMIYLPIVIVSITAERFAKVLQEESFSEAIKILGNTFAIALLTCLIFQSKVLLGVFLTYPELYFIILFVMLMLGRWIGMRVMEYRRFGPSVS